MPGGDCSKNNFPRNPELQVGKLDSPLRVKLLEIMFPLTSTLDAGVAVPMPTLPIKIAQ